MLTTVCLFGTISSINAQSTAFTYQGRLNSGANPANGSYDLTFGLFSVVSGAGQVGTTQTNTAVAVSNGLFAVTLDFGANFPGADRWLEIGVRTNTVGAFTTLTPRQKLTPTPYAMFSTTASAATTVAVNGVNSSTILDGSIVNADINAAAAIADTKLATISTSGKVANSATTANTTPAANSIVQRDASGGFSAGTITASFSGNGANLTSLNAAQLFGTVPLAQLSGITSNQLNSVTWQLATNLNGGNAKLASNVVAGIGITNAFITNSIFAGNGAGLTNLNASNFSSGTIPLSQLPAAVLTNNMPGVSLTGTFNGNGAGLTNVNAFTLGGLTGNNFWRTTGNAGTTAGINFLGTTDNQPLEIKANNIRALRIEPNTWSSIDAPTLIAGGFNNTIAVNGAAFGSTIAGGSSNVLSAAFTIVSFSTIGGGLLNANIGSRSVIGGGEGNNIASSDTFYGTIGGGYRNFFSIGTSQSTIGGGKQNIIGYGSYSATIAGGETNFISSDSGGSSIGGGYANFIGDMCYNSTIAGGRWNRVWTHSFASAIGGGDTNVILGQASYSVIDGGYGNTILTNASYSTIGGGRSNQAGGTNTTISGGEFNSIGGPDNSGCLIAGGVWNNIAGGPRNFCTISGGSSNGIGFGFMTASTIGGGVRNGMDETSFGVIGGGNGNRLANSSRSIVGGGEGNTITDSGGSAIVGGEGNKMFGPDYLHSNSAIGGGLSNAVYAKYATIPGGANNTILGFGDYSFAAGRRARILHQGTFVWADSTDADFASTANNQFLVRASGGVGINTPNPGSTFHVKDTVQDVATLESSATGGTWTSLRNTSAGGKDWRTISTGSGNGEGPGKLLLFVDGARRFEFRANGDFITTGTVNPPSDRNVKRDFAPADAQSVLAKVARLPIQTWAYTNDATIRHIGPVAQDFHAAFGLGTDDKHIATVDADGVALAAIQGLNEKLEAGRQNSDGRIQKLEVENAELKQELERIKQLVDKLASAKD